MNEKTVVGGNVPKLRFPEFRDAGEWEEKQLGKQITLVYGAALHESQRNGGKFPVVGSNGIVGYHNSYLIEGPAIVIGRKGSVGEVNWVQSNCHPIDTTYYVRNNNPDRASLVFIKLILDNCRLTELKDQSAVPGLNRDRVYSVKTAFPIPEEQQKIADCLSSIDDLITAQTQKIDALKAHKKGLMQQLFPAEGETMPKLRFPEFRDAGEWEEKKINELTTYIDYRGKSPAKYEHGIFLVTAKNIKQGYIDYESSKEYVSPDEYDEVIGEDMGCHW